MSGEGGDVLLVRLSALGDVVLATAAAQALHSQRPDLRVHFATRDTYADLVRPHPAIARVWPVPGGSAGAAAARGVRDALRAERFTAVIDLQTNTRSRRLVGGLPGLTTWRAARWQRRRWVWLRFTHPAPVRPEWLRFVDALSPLGVRADMAAPPRLGLDAGAAARAADTFARWPGGRVVFLAPGAHWASKRWPEASYLALGKALVAGGVGVLVGGDTADRAALPALSHWAEGDPAALWPPADLPGLAALVARCTVAVANDTGLGHLAAAVGVPVVTVFGSTHPALGFPVAGEGHSSLVRELACQPCTLHGRRGCPLGHHRCVREIDAAQVLRAVEARLARHRMSAETPAEG